MTKLKLIDVLKSRELRHCIFPSRFPSAGDLITVDEPTPERPARNIQVVVYATEIAHPNGPHAWVYVLRDDQRNNWIGIVAAIRSGARPEELELL
ncbi:MAG: hypothetical protein ABIA47_02045 [bacterium]